MWSRFEPSVIEDETINNAFSTNGLFKIGFDGEGEAVSKLLFCVPSISLNNFCSTAKQSSSSPIRCPERENGDRN